MTIELHEGVEMPKDFAGITHALSAMTLRTSNTRQYHPNSWPFHRNHFTYLGQYWTKYHSHYLFTHFIMLNIILLHHVHVSHSTLAYLMNSLSPPLFLSPPRTNVSWGQRARSVSRRLLTHVTTNEPLLDHAHSMGISPWPLETRSIYH